MCRGARMYFSRNTAPLPNAAAASRLASSKLRDEVGARFDDAHAAAAAAERRLDDDGIANRVGGLDGAGRLRQRVLDAGDDRHARSFGARPRAAVLSPSSSSSSAPGPTNVMPAASQAAAAPDSRRGTRSRGGSRPRPSLSPARRCLDVEIGRDGAPAFADLVGLVGLEPVQAERVLLREDGDGAQAELGGRAHDADGDLAAIQREKFLERLRAHGSGLRARRQGFDKHSILYRLWRRRTGRRQSCSCADTIGS